MSIPIYNEEGYSNEEEGMSDKRFSTEELIAGIRFDAEQAAITSRLRAADALLSAAREIVEVADLRGDSDLPHPSNDPKLWTARMQTAWDELRKAIADMEED